MNKNKPINFKLLQRSVLVLAILASGAMVYFIRDFIYPICLAILLSYLIYPLVKVLEKYLLHRGVATLLSVIFAVVVAMGTFLFLSKQFSIFAEDLPEFKDQAIENLTFFQDFISDYSGVSFSSDEWLKNQISKLMVAQEIYIAQIFDATTSALVALGVQPVYIFFMIYYRYHFREFLFQITHKKDHDVLKKILHEITSVTKNYITGIFIVVLILCVLNSAGLFIIGIRYALFLGIISALF